MSQHSRVIAIIEACEDPGRLRVFMDNGRRQGAETVWQAAFRRLIEVLPDEAPGTIEHDFWRTINAFEQIRTEERTKTTRLSRTRQKVARVGVMQTLTDFALSKKPTDGFDMLIARGLPELTGEAIVLRHAAHCGAGGAAVCPRGRRDDGRVAPQRPAADG